VIPRHDLLRAGAVTAIAGLILILALGAAGAAAWAQTASSAAAVSIRIDAGHPKGKLPAAWRFFGHDEPK
jgi:hypothetical protein